MIAQREHSRMSQVGRRQVLASLLAAGAIVVIGRSGLAIAGGSSPLSAATVPLLAALVVGGSALLAAVTVAVGHRRGSLLAVAAGLIMIGGEVATLVIAQQFSPLVVAGGLVVVALAEYQATTWPRRSGRHTAIRGSLLVLEGLIAISALDGGMALLRGAFDEVLSVAWLAGTPFGDYRLPGLVLVLVVGGSALLAAASVFLPRLWAVLASVLAGLVMVGYIVVEAISLDSKVGAALPMVLALQFLYLVPGLAIVGLAGYLWMTEYRRQPG